MYRIYIVEDDPGIAEGIKQQASSWGFEVRCADNFRDVMGEFAAFSPHLVQRDTRRVQGADNFHILGSGQHEHSNGNEYGRGRFHRKAF